MYIFDSREKKNRHIKDFFERHDIPYKVEKLDVGDYMLEGKPVVIDRKQNLTELSTNLMNREDHARFWREVRRAKEQGIKLIVLCEHGGKIKSIQDVAQWKSKYTTVSGRALMEEIYKCHISYGVEFLFCDKRSTGRRITELLEES
jgi:ERCC4-type nuclease